MRTKNNPLPEVLKLYIFASQFKRPDFFKALDGLVKNKFVEQEIRDFDKVPLEKVTISSSSFSNFVLLYLKVT